MSIDLNDIREIPKPTTKISFDTLKEKVYQNKNDDLKNKSQSGSKYQISLLDFSRMYTIYNIPFVDFFVVYVVLYCLNNLRCFDREIDFKVILISTIPITIFFNIITNKKMIIDHVIVIIFFLTAMAAIHAFITSD